MRMQSLTYLIAGILMGLLGASFALIFAYRFDHFGWDLATPYRILIVTVPSVLGLLFVWRSGTLWADRADAAASTPPSPTSMPSTVFSSTVFSSIGVASSSRSPTSAPAGVQDAQHAAPVRAAPRRWMVIGLLFAGVALASNGQQAAEIEAIQRDVQTVGFAVASMLALFTAMLEFPRVIRNILWCVVFADLLILCLCAADLAMWHPR